MEKNENLVESKESKMASYIKCFYFWPGIAFIVLSVLTFVGLIFIPSVTENRIKTIAFLCLGLSLSVFAIIAMVATYREISRLKYREHKDELVQDVKEIKKRLNGLESREKFEDRLKVLEDILKNESK